MENVIKETDPFKLHKKKGNPKKAKSGKVKS